MKYMQTGGFQNHPLMRLTLYFTLFFLFAFWVTNFALYFAKMNLAPQSVVDYYLGSEADFRMPRTYQSMLEVTHAHLPMMAMIVLMLTHLLIFSSFEKSTKVAFIVIAFLSAFLNEAGGWLVRFVHPMFAWLKVTTFIVFQSMLAFLMGSLIVFLIGAHHKSGKSSTRRQTVDKQVQKKKRMIF